MPSELAVLAEKHLTPKEQQAIEILTKDDADISIADITPRDWLFTAQAVCHARLRVDFQSQGLLLALGRLLVFAKEHPNIYKENNYEGFENFIAGEIREKWGVSRGTCYEAMRLAGWCEAAQIAPSEVKAIGRVKFRSIVSVIAKEDAGKADTRKLLEKAKEMPVAEFEQHVEAKYHVPRGTTTGAFIRFGCSKAFLKRFNGFMEDPDIQAVAGSGKIEKILDKMMEYCAEWRAKAHDGERDEAARATGD